jgi:N6-L-threonylcarbamoyladenine synthase
MRLILGIETSCDDTSIALLSSQNSKAHLLAHHSLNQDNLLKKWGGVVPEISAREHALVLKPLIDHTLKTQNLSMNEVTDIAITTQPGLIGSLLTGLHAAKTLSLVYQKPITPVHHLKAHMEMIHFEHSVAYPYLALLVSGGHTQIYWCPSPGVYELKGETLDDAAGEAFDKGGKVLGLGYPAGRYIDEKAKFGNKKFFDFPISRMKDRPGKLSFSGLKTSLRQFLEKNPNYDMSDVCASYQEAIVQALILKMKEVIRELLPIEAQSAPIILAGGVASNSRLREAFSQTFKKTFFVSPQYCTDNGAMVAFYAHQFPKLMIPFPECLTLDAKSRGD